VSPDARVDRLIPTPVDRLIPTPGLAALLTRASNVTEAKKFTVLKGWEEGLVGEVDDAGKTIP
jgi:hypothetical protein